MKRTIVALCAHSCSSILRVKVCAAAALILLVVMSIIIPPSANNRSMQLLNQRTENKEYMDRIIALHQKQQVLEESFDYQNGPGRSIDLTLFVVFHKVLPTRLFDNVHWQQVAPIGPRKHHRPNDGEGAGGAEAAGAVSAPSALGTAEAVEILANRECLNRTTIIFVATNQAIPKVYPPMVENRLLIEWEMPGYDAAHIGTTMNEYGAMDAVFKSKITQNAGRFNTNHSFSELITADADGDGVQEWIGFFQYDMRIDSKLLNNIRRRIIQKTSAKNAVQIRNRQHTQKQLLCCVFFGVSFPTNFLLMNPLGQKLLHEYNAFFGVNRRLSELPSQSIIDAFVVPTVLFNHIMPFLDAVMHRAQLNATAYPAKGDEPEGGSGSAKALDVAEAALALALGFQSIDFIVVQMPLRHEKVDG